MKTAAPAESGILNVAVAYSVFAYSSEVSPPPPGDWRVHLMAFVDMPLGPVWTCVTDPAVREARVT